MKNNILFFLILLFTIVNILDISSAYYISSGEANPIFLSTGSLLPLLILKFVIVVFFWILYFFNKYKSETYYFILILMLVLLTITIGYASYLNIYAATHSDILAKASATTVEQRTQGYFNFQFRMYIYPMLTGLISFIIFNKTRKNIIIK